MLQKFNVLSLSGGKFKDSQSGDELTFASLQFVGSTSANTNLADEIKIGVSCMKMKIDTSEDNKICKAIASSNLLPGFVVLKTDMRELKVKGVSVPTNVVVGFDLIESQKLRKG